MALYDEIMNGIDQIQEANLPDVFGALHVLNREYANLEANYQVLGGEVKAFGALNDKIVNAVKVLRDNKLLPELAQGANEVREATMVVKQLLNETNEALDAFGQVFQPQRSINATEIQRKISVFQHNVGTMAQQLFGKAMKQNLARDVANIDLGDVRTELVTKMLEQYFTVYQQEMSDAFDLSKHKAELTRMLAKVEHAQLADPKIQDVLKKNGKFFGGDAIEKLYTSLIEKTSTDFLKGIVDAQKKAIANAKVTAPAAVTDANTRAVLTRGSTQWDASVKARFNATGGTGVVKSYGGARGVSSQSNSASLIRQLDEVLAPKGFKAVLLDSGDAGISVGVHRVGTDIGDGKGGIDRSKLVYKSKNIKAKDANGLTLTVDGKDYDSFMTAKKFGGNYRNISTIENIFYELARGAGSKVNSGLSNDKVRRIFASAFNVGLTGAQSDDSKEVLEALGDMYSRGGRGENQKRKFRVGSAPEEIYRLASPHLRDLPNTKGPADRKDSFNRFVNGLVAKAFAGMDYDKAMNDMAKSGEPIVQKIVNTSVVKELEAYYNFIKGNKGSLSASSPNAFTKGAFAIGVNRGQMKGLIGDDPYAETQTGRYLTSSATGRSDRVKRLGQRGSHLAAGNQTVFGALSAAQVSDAQNSADNVLLRERRETEAGIQRRFASAWKSMSPAAKRETLSSLGYQVPDKYDWAKDKNGYRGLVQSKIPSALESSSIMRASVANGGFLEGARQRNVSFFNEAIFMDALRREMAEELGDSIVAGASDNAMLMQLLDGKDISPEKRNNIYMRMAARKLSDGSNAYTHKDFFADKNNPITVYQDEDGHYNMSLMERYNSARFHGSMGIDRSVYGVLPDVLMDAMFGKGVSVVSELKKPDTKNAPSMMANFIQALFEAAGPSGGAGVYAQMQNLFGGEKIEAVRNGKGDIIGMRFPESVEKVTESLDQLMRGIEEIYSHLDSAVRTKLEANYGLGANDPWFTISADAFHSAPYFHTKNERLKGTSILRDAARRSALGTVGDTDEGRAYADYMYGGLDFTEAENAKAAAAVSEMHRAARVVASIGKNVAEGRSLVNENGFMGNIGDITREARNIITFGKGAGYDVDLTGADFEHLSSGEISPEQRMKTYDAVVEAILQERAQKLIDEAKANGTTLDEKEALARVSEGLLLYADTGNGTSIQTTGGRAVATRGGAIPYNPLRGVSADGEIQYYTPDEYGRLFQNMLATIAGSSDRYTEDEERSLTYAQKELLEAETSEKANELAQEMYSKRIKGSVQLTAEGLNEASLRALEGESGNAGALARGLREYGAVVSPDRLRDNLMAMDKDRLTAQMATLFLSDSEVSKLDTEGLKQKVVSELGVTDFGDVTKDILADAILRYVDASTAQFAKNAQVHGGVARGVSTVFSRQPYINGQDTRMGQLYVNGNASSEKVGMLPYVARTFQADFDKDTIGLFNALIGGGVDPAQAVAMLMQAQKQRSAQSISGIYRRANEVGNIEKDYGSYGDLPYIAQDPRITARIGEVAQSRHAEAGLVSTVNTYLRNAIDSKGYGEEARFVGGEGVESRMSMGQSARALGEFLEQNSINTKHLANELQNRVKEWLATPEGANATQEELDNQINKFATQILNEWKRKGTTTKLQEVMNKLMGNEEYAFGDFKTDIGRIGLGETFGADISSRLLGQVMSDGRWTGSQKEVDSLKSDLQKYYGLSNDEIGDEKFQTMLEYARERAGGFANGDKALWDEKLAGTYWDIPVANSFAALKEFLDTNFEGHLNGKNGAINFKYHALGKGSDSMASNAIRANLPVTAAGSGGGSTFDKFGNLNGVANFNGALNVTTETLGQFAQALVGSIGAVNSYVMKSSWIRPTQFTGQFFPWGGMPTGIIQERLGMLGKGAQRKFKAATSDKERADILGVTVEDLKKAQRAEMSAAEGTYQHALQQYAGVGGSRQRAQAFKEFERTGRAIGIEDDKYYQQVKINNAILAAARKENTKKVLGENPFIGKEVHISDAFLRGSGITTGTYNSETIAGTIDALVGTGDTASIFDYKSHGVLAPKDVLQLGLYSALLREYQANYKQRITNGESADEVAADLNRRLEGTIGVGEGTVNMSTDQWASDALGNTLYVQGFNKEKGEVVTYRINGEAARNAANKARGGAPVNDVVSEIKTITDTAIKGGNSFYTTALGEGYVNTTPGLWGVNKEFEKYSENEKELLKAMGDTTITDNEFGKRVEAQAKLYQEIADQITKLESNGFLSEEQKQQVENLKNSLEAIRTAYQEQGWGKYADLSRASAQADKEAASKTGDAGAFAQENAAKAKAERDAYYNRMGKRGWDDSNRKNRTDAAFVPQGGAPTGGKLGDIVLRSVFGYGGLDMKFVSAIRKTIGDITQSIYTLDKAVTNLRVVTGANASEAATMMKNYNQLAQTLGTTTAAVAQNANEWMRQGYSANEAQKLITSSVYLAKLGMISEQDAVARLTSSLKGFKLEAEEAMGVVDKLTSLDMRYAASAGEIAQALSRTAAVAQQAGLTLDQTAAAVTIIADVTQESAEMVGTSVRSILSRFGQVKAGSFTSLMGGEEDAKALNDIEKVLGTLGIQMRSSTMDMRNFGDVLDDLAQKWTTLSDVEKNAVATSMAGTRQRNAFLTLMENYDSYQEAIKVSANAEGTASLKYGAYQDSIEYAKNRGRAALEAVAEEIRKSGLIKTLADVTYNFSKSLPVILPLLTKVLSMQLAERSFNRAGNASLGGVWGRMIGNSKTGGTGKGKGATEGAAGNGAKGAFAYQQRDLKSAFTLGGSQALAAFMTENSATDELTTRMFKKTPAKYLTEVKESGGEKALQGVISGALAGVGGYFLGPLGAMLGSTLGDAVGTVIKYVAHRDELERKQRVEIASKQLDALKSVEDTIRQSATLATKSLSEWTSEDYSSAQDQARKMIDAINAVNLETGIATGKTLENYFVSNLKKLGTEFNNATNALQAFAEGSEEAAKIVDAYSAAEIRAAADAEYASTEEERQNLIAKYSSEQFAMARLWNATTNKDERSKLERQYYKKYGQTIDSGYSSSLAMEAALNDFSNKRSKSYLESAAILSGANTMSGVSVANTSLAALVYTVAQNLVGMGEEGVFDSDGKLNSGVSKQIEQQLRKYSNLGSLFRGGSRTYSQMQGDQKRVAELAAALGMSVDDMFAEAFKKEVDESKFGEYGSEYVRNLIGFSSEESMADFAHGFGLASTEVEKLGDAVDILSGVDARNNVDALIEKFESLESTFVSLTSGAGITKQALDKIIQETPTLLFSGGKFNPSSLGANILSGFASGGYGSAIGYKYAADMASDAGYWDLFKQSLGIQLASDWGRYGLENGAALQGVSTFETAMRQNLLSDEMKQRWTDFVSSLLTQLVDTTQLSEKASQLMNHNLDLQIDQLTSIKDALSTINDERQKEIDLIKAREALENAKNEKRRVYRAGIGFTYETDQEAVKQARENLERLETERQQENVQYQIDQLQTQKDILGSLQENKQLQNLTDAFKGFIDGSSMSKFLQFYENIDNKEGAFYRNIAAAVNDGTQGGRIAEQADAAFNALAGAKNTLGQKYQEYQAALNGGDIVQQNLAYKEYEAASAAYDAALRDAAGYQGQDPDRFASLSSMETRNGLRQVAEVTKERLANKPQSQALLSTKGIEGVALANPGESSIGVDLGDALLSQNAFTENDFKAGTNDGKKAPLVYDPATKTWSRSTTITSYQDAKNAGSGTLFLFTHGSRDYLVANVGGELKFVPIYTASDTANGLQDLKSGGELKFGDTIFNEDIPDSLKGHALGAISLPHAESSLINEFGLEGIITPQGTITALPAKTGIVPADLTKNLYELGEVAPTLIRRIGGEYSEFTSKDLIEDNSTNVQNLYATIEATQDFDFEKFMKEVRAAAGTTRHQ